MIISYASIKVSEYVDETFLRQKNNNDLKKVNLGNRNTKI
jgi:hypothetical protein